MRSWLHFAVLVLVGALAVAIFFSWRAEHVERDRLQLELAETQKTLAVLDEKQKNRDAELARSLSVLAQQKKAVQTPSQALRALPEVLPLPVPLQEQSLAVTPVRNAAPDHPDSPQPKDVVLPSEDLKPLYDFAVDCKACQARLAVAQADLSDEKAKTQTLSKERDAALRIARGGSFWKRVGRAAKWFAIGAAAGALAVKASR